MIAPPLKHLVAAPALWFLACIRRLEVAVIGAERLSIFFPPSGKRLQGWPRLTVRDPGSQDHGTINCASMPPPSPVSAPRFRPLGPLQLLGLPSRSRAASAMQGGGVGGTASCSAAASPHDSKPPSNKVPRQDNLAAASCAGKCPL